MDLYNNTSVIIASDGRILIRILTLKVQLITDKCNIDSIQTRGVTPPSPFLIAADIEIACDTKVCILFDSQALLKVGTKCQTSYRDKTKTFIMDP